MDTNKSRHLKTIFFGTSFFSVLVLDELKNDGFLPTLIITAEDKPVGRKLILTPPPVKIWAMDHGIPHIQPKSLRKDFLPSFITEHGKDWDLFLVASYGKIIPKEVLDIPRFGALNVHPSLLPKLRGASPLQSAILFENETGVTIMKIDEEMDHGPLLDQKKIDFPSWPPSYDELEKVLGKEGGKMLADIIPPWIEGKIKEIPQNHIEATFTKKIEKEDGYIDLLENPELNYRKIQAFSHWPKAYYFEEVDNKKIRVNVTEAELRNGELKIKRVIPEGRKEMRHDDFLRGLRK